MTRIPTLQELYTSVIADLESEFQITIPVFGKAFLRALAAVQAAKLKLYYLALGNLQKNVWVDTAEKEAIGGTLERFGRVKLGRDPFPASQGQYRVVVTGTAGATIPAQTTFKSDDSSLHPGKLFILDFAYTLVADVDYITIRALEAGLDSRMSISETLTATAPIIGVDDLATVTSETVAPQAAEDIEEYRAKAIAAFRSEPQGGSASDYRLWSFDAQGVQQSYPYAKSGSPNEVDIYVEATEDDSIDGKGTPSTTILNNVSSVIELDPDTSKPILERGRRPLTVFAVNVLPVVIKEIDITITGFSDITPEKEADIENALREAIKTIRPFIAGADILSSRNDNLGQNNIINVILNTVPGSIFFSVSMEVDGVVKSTYQFTEGEIPYLNSVSYA